MSFYDTTRYDAEYNKLRALVLKTLESHAQQPEKPADEASTGKHLIKDIP